MGGALGGRIEGVVGTLLIVKLGSLVFFSENTMCVLAHVITRQKSIMVHPPCKYFYRLIRGRGTRWGVSDLTWGVVMMGLLVF
jgi:hypothetical protein